MPRTPRAATRRTFLQSAALGLGSLSLQPECFAGGRGDRLPRLSLLIVSDTHLGYRDQEHAAQQWEKTAAELGKAPAERIVHLGDVVDGGREAQYPIYQKIRDTIGKPVHEIPGNHDPLPLFEKHLRREVDTVVDHGWLRLLLLHNARTDSHDGFLSDAQLQWIDSRCREAARDGVFVALAMHVPVHTNLHPDRGWYVHPEHGQKQLYEILNRHRGQVLCLMHGHFHNGIRGWDDHPPVHEIVFPSALYNLDRRLEAQQAPGYNLPEFRPGYTLLSIHEGQLRLEYHPTGAAERVEKSLPLAQLEQAGSR